MTDRDKALAALRAGIGGIDPVLDQAANYGRGMRAVQGLMAEQGQMASSALQNNEILYHTNKQLKLELQAKSGELSSLERKVTRLEQQLEQQKLWIRVLEAAGGDRWKPLYDEARQALNNHLFDALTPEQVREKMRAMDAQAKELAADPKALKPEDIERIKREELPGETTDAEVWQAPD